jgi:Flp pilus assembly protein TadG
MRSHFRRVCAGKEEGQTLVEFAVVLLPFLMLTFGLIKFAVVCSNQVTLNNAVASSARSLAESRCTGTGCPANYCTPAVAALDQAAVSLNTTQITTNLTTSSPAPFPSPDASTCTNLVANDTVTVQATYPCNLQILALNVWPTCSLSAQTTIRIE